jgi:hypothetical protein
MAIEETMVDGVVEVVGRALTCDTGDERSHR